MSKARMTRQKWLAKRSLDEVRAHNRRLLNGRALAVGFRSMTQANYEATRSIRWGYHRTQREPASLDTPRYRDAIVDPDGTPLDRLIAWEAVERRLKTLEELGV